MARWLALIVLGGCWLNEPPVAEPTPIVRAVEAPRVTAMIGPTTLSPDMVLAKIHEAYMGGVKRCYSVLLKHQPTAHGKVTIVFTVDADGIARHGEAHGLGGTVDACIASLMAGWKFAEPKTRDGTPTEASFVMPLEMTPD